MMSGGADELARTRPLPDLPFEVRLAVDRLLARFDGTDPLRDDPDFIALAEWLTEADDDLGGLDGDEPNLTPIIPEAETGNLSDEILTESLEDADEILIDDDARAEFVTAHLRDLLTNEVAADGDYHPACGFRRLGSSDGRVAVIAYGIRGYSFSGIALEWFGLFTGVAGFVERQRREGWLFELSDLDGMSRARKLALWDRDPFG